MSLAYASGSVSLGHLSDPLHRAGAGAFLVRVLLRENDAEGAEQNLQVQPKRPFADVLMIVADAFSHLFDCFRLATTTADLRQPGFTLCRSM